MSSMALTSNQSIGAVDFFADAHEAAVFRIVDTLKHPDDLTNKLKMLRKKIAMEKASVDAQLKIEMKSQLDTTQKGIDALQQSKQDAIKIHEHLTEMNKICGGAEGKMKNYAFIQKISCAHQNFTRTKILVEKFQQLSAQMIRVAKLLDEDYTLPMGPANNMLFVHYQIQKLCKFRSSILTSARGSSSDVLNTLTVLFKKLDQLEYKFDTFFWELAKNTMDLVRGGFGSTVVRLIKIIEVEEKNDEFIARKLNANEIMGEKGDELADGQIKGYRVKYFDSLREKIARDFNKIYCDNNMELEYVLGALEPAIDELQLVRDEFVPLYPKRYNIFHFYVLEYHRAIHDMINDMLEETIDSSSILFLIKWVKDYYEKMAQKLDVSEDMLEPALLDGREAELLISYVDKMKMKLTEWLNNIIFRETREFLDRTMPPEMDNSGQYLMTGSVIAFQMFNEQIDVVIPSSTGKLLYDIVVECCRVMSDFQNEWLNHLDQEYTKFTKKSTTLNEGLIEYVIALANDCVRSSDFSENISVRLEGLADEPFKARHATKMKELIDGFLKIQKKCVTILVEIVMSDVTPAINVLHCAQWYEQDVMALIIGTFEDYGKDFEKHMSQYMFNKLSSELIDRFLVAYLDTFRNKNTKFKMPNAPARMKNDIDNVINFFSKIRSAKRVQASFEVIQKMIALIESSPRMIYIDFYSLWKQYPDVQMEYIEKVLQKRDDLDKATLRETIDLCKSKTKDERTENFEPTVFSKLSLSK